MALTSSRITARFDPQGLVVTTVVVTGNTLILDTPEVLTATGLVAGLEAPLFAPVSS